MPEFATMMMMMMMPFQKFQGGAHTMPRQTLSKAEVMYSQQLSMMQGDLLGGPDDAGLGVELSGAEYTDQHGAHLLNRAINNRFMLSQASKMYQIQQQPHSLSHAGHPPPPHPHHGSHQHTHSHQHPSAHSQPLRQRGRKPQNVHPSMAMEHQHQSYVTVKQEPGVPHGMLMGDMFSPSANLNQLVMQNSADIGVGQNMELTSANQSVSLEANPQGDIILVPSNMLKQGMMEGGEVVVGGNIHTQSIGNEIEIGGHNGRRGMVAGLGGSVAGTSSSDDNDFDESALVIDTETVVTTIMGGGYDCAQCGAVMKSRGSLKKHIAKYHATAPEPDVESENRYYACPACQYQTQRRDKLDKHIGKHLAEGMTITGKKRPSKVSSFPQRMRHAAEEYRCAMCPYKCTVEKALRKHHKLHLSGTKQFVVKVSCPICGKDRSTEADLRKHMKKHRNDKDFHCDICGFASIQLKKIIQHRRMHTGEKPHLCPHCTYRSSRRDNLRSHVRRMHKKENMYIDTFNPRMDCIVVE